MTTLLPLILSLLLQSQSFPPPSPSLLPPPLSAADATTIAAPPASIPIVKAIMSSALPNQLVEAAILAQETHSDQSAKVTQATLTLRWPFIASAMLRRPSGSTADRRLELGHVSRDIS